MERMNKMYENRGYCYFAVELLKQQISSDDWTGLESFRGNFTPCVRYWMADSIKRFWNQGYASEGAKRCLEFASESRNRMSPSMASIGNEASTQVMKKIGMILEGFWSIQI